MKKRFSAIFVITVAAVLASSVVYASKKKLQTKSKTPASDVSEAELAAGLLDAKGDHKRTAPIVTNTSIRSEMELKELSIADNTKK